MFGSRARGDGASGRGPRRIELAHTPACLAGREARFATTTTLRQRMRAHSQLLARSSDGLSNLSQGAGPGVAHHHFAKLKGAVVVGETGMAAERDLSREGARAVCSETGRSKSLCGRTCRV